jgi:hypothetical protein
MNGCMHITVQSLLLALFCASREIGLNHSFHCSLGGILYFVEVLIDTPQTPSCECQLGTKRARQRSERLRGSSVSCVWSVISRRKRLPSRVGITPST